MKENTLRPNFLMKWLFLATLLLAYLSLSSTLYSLWGWWGILLSQVGLLWLPGKLLSKKLELKLSLETAQRLPKINEVLCVFLITLLVIFAIERLTQWQARLWPLPKEVEAFYTQLTTIRSGWFGLLQFVSLVIAPAFCEEIFFRGWLQTALEQNFLTLSSRKIIAQSAAIFLTASLFAVVHLNPWYLPQYFLLGIFLSTLKTWRGQISFCILAHFFNNLMSVYGNF